MKYLEIAGNFKRNENWDVIRDMKVRGGNVHDMTKLPIPWIEDETYDGTYSEHFIEHLTKNQGINFFVEMKRVLKAGGVIRIVWPSMDFIDELNGPKDLSSNPFVEMYNKYIISRENNFIHPYYNNVMPLNQINKLSPQKKVALRLLHQEGEHKHLWYKNEMIDCLLELGFKDVKEEPYRKSRLADFEGLDKDDPMRTLHSTVIEAYK